MSVTPSIRHMFGCTVSLLLVALFQVESTAEGVPDALRQAWQRRQDAVTSARFEWQSDCDMRPLRGPQTAPKTASGKGARPEEQPTPLPEAAPIPIRVPKVFMLKGAKCRYLTRQINLKEKVSNHTEGGYLSTFDGHRSMRLKDGKAGSQNTGTILAPPVYDDVKNVHFRAITLCFRPLDPSFQGDFELSDFDLVSTEETVDGQPCMLLRQRADRAKNGIVNLLHVDPAREFVVLRWAEEVDGRLSAQIDITYSQDATIGWVPSGWNLAFMPRGVIVERCTAKVTDYALNEPLSDKLFVIDFPAGTFVDDRASGTQYLVRRGGEKRPIAPVERRRGATWEELMATEYGQAGLRTDRWSYRTLIVAIGGFLALCVVVLLVRRWRSS
ncbi:MAG TPA: hypothetical protein VMP01_15670 [Pirellulaceae bacterium]|nr:hypothetical protein [Pirellulaceae bacterium]